MPRGRLNEKYEKHAAIKWLLSYYRQKRDFLAAISNEEAGVAKRSKFGYGRADGLLVAQRSNGRIFTASLEAKSSRTFFNIFPGYKDDKWVLHAVVAGTIGLILAGGIARSLGGDWFWMWVFPPIVFVVVGLAYLLITHDFSYYRPIDVISQVKGYPADEQWIALSTDAFNQLGQEGRRTLRKDCRREGIGLIRIRAGEKATALEKPRIQKLPRGYKDFLVCYTRENVLREKLQSEINNVQGLVRDESE